MERNFSNFCDTSGEIEQEVRFVIDNFWVLISSLLITWLDFILINSMNRLKLRSFLAGLLCLSMFTGYWRISSMCAWSRLLENQKEKGLQLKQQCPHFNRAGSWLNMDMVNKFLININIFNWFQNIKVPLSQNRFCDNLIKTIILQC